MAGRRAPRVGLQVGAGAHGMCTTLTISFSSYTMVVSLVWHLASGDAALPVPRRRKTTEQRFSSACIA